MTQHVKTCNNISDSRQPDVAFRPNLANQHVSGKQADFHTALLSLGTMTTCCCPDARMQLDIVWHIMRDSTSDAANALPRLQACMHAILRHKDKVTHRQLETHSCHSILGLSAVPVTAMVSMPSGGTPCKPAQAKVSAGSPRVISKALLSAGVTLPHMHRWMPADNEQTMSTVCNDMSSNLAVYSVRCQLHASDAHIVPAAGVRATSLCALAML